MDRDLVLGRKAEHLVEEMLHDLGFEYYWFGCEHRFTQFTGPKKGQLKGKAWDFIRNQPDFFIVDLDTSHAYFLEVKYRTSKIIFEKDFSMYPDTYTLRISPKGMFIVDGNYQKKHPENKLPFKPLDYIGPFRYKNKAILHKYYEKAKNLHKNLEDY